MKRAILAALVLLAGLGGLCTAWYASSQRALAAELHEREHAALRAVADRERTIAENLARRLEQLRVDESQRPYFQYQNLYHDPKGVSEGLSIVPSPLANGSGNPLVTAYFQIESKDKVTLPTLNEEVRELNAPNAAEQIVVRDSIARSSAEMREAAVPLIESLKNDDAQMRATAERIADLEARLAEATRPRAAAPAPKVVAKKESPPQKLQQLPSQQSQIIDSSAFEQNARANTFYRDLKQRAVSNNEPPKQQQQQQQVAEPEPATQTPSPPQTRAARRPRPVEIRTTDLVWQSIAVDRKPRLVALRGVLTPEGTLVQGMLTPLAEGATFEGAHVATAALSGRGAAEGSGTHNGTSIDGTGWRVQLDPAASIAAIRRDHARELQRFQRTFAGVTALLLLVIAGTVWMVSRAEALALEKSRFAATAAHELRTPLASLRLYSEMIADERDPARRERYAREIAGQTERLGRLVANVLEVTRIERGTFALHAREGNIGSAVEACVEKLRPQMEAAGCPVELRVADDLPAVVFDEDALHNIVDNLVDNAEKYSRESPERNVAVDVAREKDGVSITVRDRGPGFSEDVIRDPKPFRKSSGGLGIGLFLVDRIVRAHGGALRSARVPGGGASVQVFLPAFYKA
jgi:signal transduction histidine kinase